MRFVVRLTLLWPVLLVGCTLGMDFGSAADASDWDAVTGQEWRVQALDGRPVIDGTAITVVFDGGDGVSGNAGTNRYMGAYERTGAQGLAVSELAATRMYLDVPPGRMAQETTYLDLLQSVERFTLEGDRLTLWAEGDSSIRYARAP